MRRASRVDYLHALLLPAVLRDAFLVLRAFHHEMNAITRRIREPALGEIRLQWWADGLRGARAAEMASHPIGSALTLFLNGREHAREPLARKAEAHAGDLYADPPEDRTAFESHAGATHSVLWQLLAMEADERGAPDAAGHLGVAEGVANAALFLPNDSARGVVRIPADLLAAHGTTPEAWPARPQPDALRAFAAYGLDHVARAREARAPVASRFRGRLAVIERTLAKVARAPEAAIEGRVAPGPLVTQWLLWRG